MLAVEAEKTAAVTTNVAGLVLIAILLILVTILVLHFLKNIVMNAVLGVIALFLVNFVGSYFGISIPLNLVTLVICALFGPAGVGVLLLLVAFGVTLAF